MSGTDPQAQEWDEAEYERALAHLEILADQITELRTCIPSLITPLIAPSATKSTAFFGLKKAAVGAVTDVKALRTEWESEETKKVFDKAKQRYEEDPDLSKAKDVPTWGWKKEDGVNVKTEDAT